MSNSVVWDPAAYAANSANQQAWARELIARLKLRGDERLLDVGCGDGKVTAELSLAVPRGEVVGVDASKEMIGFASESFSPARHPNLKFQTMDARELNFSKPFDAVFSNAALHWVNDHPAFLRGAGRALRSGGRLLVSCGGKGNAQDVFVALRPEMRRKRWREFFHELEPKYFFHAPAAYEIWLPRFAFKVQRVELEPRDSTYPGAAGFATWLRTTWLPYTQRVPAELREEFIAGVVERYVSRHPADASGAIHVRMVRLEIDAIKI